MLSLIVPAVAVASPPAFEVETFSTRAVEALAVGPLDAVLYGLLAVVWLAGMLVVVGLALVYLERKIAGHFQCRLGPMRVGPHGIFQTVADALKLLVKEDFVPDRADRILHVVAPFFALAATMLSMMIMPFSPYLQVADMNIGVVYVTAISGFGVLSILLAGWSSNNKWSLVGAMRAGAQIVSYGISATLALLVVVLFSGTLQLSEIVRSQADGWWIWRAHGVGIIAFLVYLIASTAEINRTPFDIPEGESELTGGFHTEYSGIRFAFFFLAEFINMFLIAGFAATFFFGGWMPFHVGGFAEFNAVMDVVPPFVWFGVKTGVLIFVIMWFRWTFPRLRVDQLMRLEWKILLPIGFVNLFAAAFVVLYRLYFFAGP